MTLSTQRRAPGAGREPPAPQRQDLPNRRPSRVGAARPASGNAFAEAFARAQSAAAAEKTSLR